MQADRTAERQRQVCGKFAGRAACGAGDISGRRTADEACDVIATR